MYILLSFIERNKGSMLENTIKYIIKIPMPLVWKLYIKKYVKPYLYILKEENLS